MSRILDQAACEDAQRREDLARSDAALIAGMFKLEAANQRPVKRAFVVQIKSGRDVLMEFGAMGVDSLAVAAEYDRLKGLGQYIRVVPAARKEEPLPVSVLRNELAQLALRQPVESDWVTFDEERDVDKGRTLAARNDAHALDLQVQHLRAIGGL